MLENLFGSEHLVGRTTAGRDLPSLAASWGLPSPIDLVVPGLLKRVRRETGL